MLTSPGPRRMIATPSRISSPPRVTMNDGILSRATNDPWMAPTAEQASNAAMIAAHHGQLAPLGCTNSATMTLPKAMTSPTERSISPRSRAKISAIASTMYTVLCSSRLTRFCGDRNFGFATWKLMATTTMASTTGRTPLSPLRSRSHQARKYWPSDWARSSGGTSATASGAAVRSVAVPASTVPGGVSPGSAVTGVSRSGDMGSALTTGGSGRLGRPPGGATCRHVLHHALPVEVRGRPLGHHPPQVQHRDPVRDLEDVVQVVADHHDRQPAVAEPPDQVQH